ncbi:MAG: matrixin family metalloprotease [bacterium]
MLKSRRLRLKCNYLFLIAFLLLPLIFKISVCSATLPFKEPSEDELINESDLVLIGRVESQHSVWNDQKTHIFTYTTISVEKVIKGAVSGYDIQVKSEGGQVGEIGEASEFQVVFTLGEKVQLYLQRVDDKLYIVTHKCFGKISLEAGFEGFEENRLGYTFSGYTWSSSAFPLPYYISQDGTADTTEEFVKVQEGVNLWSAVANCPAEYKGTTSKGFGYDGANIHIWVTDLPDNYGGEAYVWFTGSRIVEGDIRYNDNYNWSDTQKIVGLTAHEWGHVLGLDHSTLSTATMYPSINLLAAATLSDDDISAIQALYGESTGGSTTTIPTLGDIGIIICLLALSCLIIFKKPNYRFSGK